MHALDATCAARDDGELRIEALEIELADDAVMTLSDEESPRAGLKLLDELELPLAQSKPFDVVVSGRLNVGEEDLGRGLLDDRAADGALQDIARALRRQTHHPVELSPGLRSILRKALKGRVGQEGARIHPSSTPADGREADGSSERDRA